MLDAKAPACVNGYLQVQAEGYAPQRQLFSSTEESSADLILDKLYAVKLNVTVGGRPLREEFTLITFEGPQPASVAYPEVKNVSLSEGLYNVTVTVYGKSNLTIPATKSRECHDAPSPGLLGLFGGTHEECFDVELPATTVEQVLVGGGSVSTYLLPRELEKGALLIDVPRLPVPTSLAQLQTNYEVFASQKAEVNFR